MEILPRFKSISFEKPIVDTLKSSIWFIPFENIF